ncbi:guanylate kinase [Desulfonatronum thiodismutans]|uniref:guanylate kinase n=1 Tax=Desulfonatronum thiodismutans TaxID=159290 RepID=UPI0004ABE2C2|nr:guanylate kinase [Desulfonatronum thiodismutans]
MAAKPGRSRQGILFVISAPSGTGKSTLINRLRAEFPDLAFSVSYTTRAPRTGEENGREYHFVDAETFIRLRDAGELAEWAEVHGNFYGTSRPVVQTMLDQGRDVLFDIDVQGSRQLRQAFDQGAFVFLFPPSMRVLEQRLRGRGTETEESLTKRLANARRELEQAEFFDYWIVNDDLESAYRDLRGVYQAEGLRKSCNLGLVEQVLAS